MRERESMGTYMQDALVGKDETEVGPDRVWSQKKTVAIMQAKRGDC